MSFSISDSRSRDQGNYWLRQACVPAGFLRQSPSPPRLPHRTGSPLVDLLVSNGRIARIVASTARHSSDVPVLDLAGRQLWPTLVRHACPPRQMPGHPTHQSGRDLRGVVASAPWRTLARSGATQICINACRSGCAAPDVHGVSSIWTHLDFHEGLSERGWAVFRDIRAEWSGRDPLAGSGSGAHGRFPRRIRSAALRTWLQPRACVLGGVTRAAGKDHAGSACRYRCAA